MSEDKSIGSAFEKLLKKSPWGGRMEALNINDDWEKIVGKTIARHTDKLFLQDGTLRVYTNIAPLKQELLLEKIHLIKKINEFYDRDFVKDIVVI